MAWPENLPSSSQWPPRVLASKCRRKRRPILGHACGRSAHGDLEPGDDPSQPYAALYHGAAGVCWALHHLQDLGAAQLSRNHLAHLDELLPVDGVGLRAHGGVERPKGRPSDLWGEGRGERAPW